MTNNVNTSLIRGSSRHGWQMLILPHKLGMLFYRLQRVVLIENVIWCHIAAVYHQFAININGIRRPDTYS